MAEETPSPVFTALLAAQRRGLLPTSLGTAGLRQLEESLLARSVFSARVTSADFLTQLKAVVDAMAGGNMDDATARVTLLECLRALGYTPEGGFPDAPAGAVPPALRGTLQDLTSYRRLKLITETQRDLMRGAGQQMRGAEAERLAMFPAWELVRVLSAQVPRNWGGKFIGEVRGKQRFIDPRPRWQIAGGKLYQKRMIALKGDPVWGELGASENFSDALNVDHPPFAFRSGMGWREIGLAECEKLGVTGPNGESIEEWQAIERPVIGGKLPAIEASAKTMAPALRAALVKSTGAKVADGALTLDDLAARRLARLNLAVGKRLIEVEARK